LLPELQKGILKQRQSARLIAHISNEQVHEARIELTSDKLRWSFDSGMQLFFRHWSYQFVIIGQRCG
jgi:hypothetical protein